MAVSPESKRFSAHRELSSINPYNSVLNEGGNWEHDVPRFSAEKIESLPKGNSAVLQHAPYKGVHDLAKMWADPGKQRGIGGLSVKETMVRPLRAVKREETGPWEIIDARYPDIPLGSGSTKEDAIVNAKARDIAQKQNPLDVSIVQKLRDSYKRIALLFKK